MRLLPVVLLLALTTSLHAQVAAVSTNLTITYTNLQDAIDAAGYEVEVRVSAGTFTETLLISNKNLILSGGWQTNFTSQIPGVTSVVDGALAGNTIWIRNSTVAVQRLEIKGGEASLASFFAGGGLLANQSRVVIQDCLIQSNGAWFGGGLFVGVFSSTVVARTTIRANQAIFLGGGVFVDGEAQVAESTIANNSTWENGSGGGLCVNTGIVELAAVDIVDNVCFSSNGLSFGGGIYSVDSVLYAQAGSSLVSNQASKGGGLAALNSTVILGQAGVPDDVTLSQNLAYDLGGGLQTEGGVLQLRGVTVADNLSASPYQSLSYGGGISALNTFVDGSSGFNVIRDNEAEVSGGGLSVSFGSVQLFGTEIRGNVANGGGGIDAINLTLGMVSCLVQSNRANGVSGGGMNLQNCQTVLTDGPAAGGMTQMVVEGNSTLGRGGGIAVIDGVLSVSNLVLRGNVAGSGGGLHSLGSSVVVVATSALIDNEAAVDGGGFWFGGYTGWVHRSVIDANLALRNGGGILMTNGELLVTSSRITGNHSHSNGGGIATFEGGSFIMRPADGEPAYLPGDRWQSVLQGNTAADNGGAIFVLKTDELLLNGTAILENHSRTAPVWLSQAFQHDLVRCVIASNLTDVGDNVIHASFHTTRVVRCTLVDNPANGGITVENGFLFVSNSILNEDNLPILVSGSPSGTNVSHCMAPIPLDGVNNMTGTPVFLFDYHLAHDSPGINQGSFDAIPDIDGEPVGAFVDIGADEFLDQDKDRLPNWIESGSGTYVGDWDSGSALDDPDTDDDGVDDYDEWYATTDPTDSNSLLRITGIRTDGTGVQVDWQGGFNVYQQVEWSPDPTDTNWQFVVGALAPTPPTNQAWLNTNFASGVVRVRPIR